MGIDVAKITWLQARPHQASPDGRPEATAREWLLPANGLVTSGDREQPSMDMGSSGNRMVKGLQHDRS